MRERRPKSKSGGSRSKSSEGKPARDKVIAGGMLRARKVVPAKKVAASVLRRSTGGFVRGKISVPATEAKNRFGEVMKAATSRRPVFIERHGRDQVVVLDIDTYKSLLEKRRTPDEKRLEELREEFDALYARMQTPASRKATDKLLAASDEEIDRALAPRG
jgi:prevent-host-death family protein